MAAMTQSQSSLVVVGSVAIDWIITPTDSREESVGGAATFFSLAASYFTPVNLVGVVGNDFPDSALNDLRTAGVDLAGLEVVDDGLTFRWKGRYHENMNDRDTLETHLNVFESFSPELPESYRTSNDLFLANIQPTLQKSVLEQMEKARFVGLDTMNLWIDIAADELKDVLKRIDVLTINEEEAIQLSAASNIVDAARIVQGMGPKWLVIKRGAYGAMLFGPDGGIFSAPAMPLADVIDPTGAGDSFAGGFMGYLSRKSSIDDVAVRNAVVWGSVMASFCVQGFSYDRLNGLSRADIAQRHKAFTDMMRLEAEPVDRVLG